MAADNGKMMGSLYSKLTDVLTMGSNIQSPGHSFLVLMNPGTFLDPTLDLNKPDDGFLWAEMLNRIPFPNPIFQETALSIPSLYQQILNGKELPIVTLTPDQQKQLDDANALLIGQDGDSTPLYDRYLTFMDAYQVALAAFQQAQADFKNEGTPIPPRTRADLDAARTKWDVLGKRQVVETAAAVITNLQGLDPNAWWAKLQKTFDQNALPDTSGNNYFRTQTFPAYQTFFGGKGWTTFSFTQSDVENQQMSKSLSTGGSAGLDAGMWRASASAQYTKDQGFKSTQTTDIKISLDVMRVSISRPWIDPLVLRSRAWRWGPGASGNLISNGADASLGQTASGDMPLYPTTLVLSRNLVLQGAFGTDESSWIDTALQTQASVGYGPFSIKGNYNQSNGEKSSSAKKEGDTITNPDVQIIGMFCEVLPTSPNPSPLLHWPSGIELNHLPEFHPEVVERVRQSGGEALRQAVAAR